MEENVIKKIVNTIILSSILVFVLIGCNFIFGKEINRNNVRTIDVTERQITYQELLNSFDNTQLLTEGSLSTFAGTKVINAELLKEFDEVSVEEYSNSLSGEVKYNFSYDKDKNVVTITAEYKNEFGEIQIDNIQGSAFINDNNEIDAVMNIDGEGILLSEMRESGMIANCGWFSRLVKKVVKVVVKTVVVSAIALATAAVVVATAAVAAPALVAVGIGVVGASAGAVLAGATAGAIFAMTVGQSALQAGTAIAQQLGESIELILDKTSKAVLEIVYKGMRFVMQLLTAEMIGTLAKNAYFIAMADASDGNMYYSPVAITRDFAVSIVNYNSAVSVYTFDDDKARSVAQEAGNNESPVWDRHHKPGYFDHYHRGDIPHDEAISHVFYGLPKYS